KKQIETMLKMKEKFINGAKERGMDEKVLSQIWSDWENFAQYAFNKSHAACYAIVAFHTAYLKANYPAEFMAATLNSLNSIDDITFYMEECRRMKMPVLGPDINESKLGFSVNAKGEIRFGMSAIKGVGEVAAIELIKEREANGRYKSIFELTKRSNLKSVNKRVLESLAKAGAFDGFDSTHRAQYFHKAEGDDSNILEKAIRFGASAQANDAASQASLFGAGSATSLAEPKIPACEPWGLFEKLEHEKDVVGMYLTGHPLDDYRFEMEFLCKNRVSELNELDKLKGREVFIGGIVSGATERMSKTGKPWGSFTLNDLTGSYEIRIFGKEYMDFKNYFQNGYFLFVRGKVQTREWPKDSTELEFKMTKVELLTDIKDKMLKAIVLTLDINRIEDEVVSGIQQFAHRDKGAQLCIHVYDAEKGMKVNLFSKQYRVTPDKEWLRFVRKNELQMDVKWS
ncbi:MAG TPA: OB-fold nucleic acid binding domain-containing protein, partial [Bacteroidia bacterium]|nr:OB-fold nucleic acid binding domain-containing protein [Bacteroidia bacterium]